MFLYEGIIGPLKIIFDNFPFDVVKFSISYTTHCCAN